MLKRCKKCGHEVFLIDEGLVHKAGVDGETGILEAYKVIGDGVGRIYCEKCNTDYDESEFEGVEFCY